MEMNRALIKDKEFYRLVPDPSSPDDEYYCIELTQGEYKGLVYKYGDVHVNRELNEDGTLPVKFEYDIVYVPEDLLKKEFEDEKKHEFENFIGNIMMEMIQEQLEIEDLEEDNGKRTNRDNDSDKFTVKRRVHTQGGAISQD